MTLALVKDSDLPNDSATFADFWTLWPKRVARMEAEKAWKRLTPSECVAALVGLIAWRPLWIAEGRLQYVPNASTWLNQQRWTDEMPDKWTQSHASHLPAKPMETTRTEMPQSVKDAIARLRK
jgi:hypothetical protein